jgi:hypothetical protein
MFTVETLERTNVDSVNIPLADIHPEEGTSMFSNTYMPAVRQPAKRIATGAVTALILAAFAQTSGATDTATRVGPEAHWSSQIGTGRPFVTGSERQQLRTKSTAPQDASASAHWSARIGTGRAAVESRAAPVAPSIAGDPAPTHWSAQIGTGRVSPGLDVRKLPERKGPAEARTIAEPLRDHPATRVAQNWSRRGIDPNTFIVLHPAGPTASALNK